MFGGNTLIANLLEQREFKTLISNEAEDTSGRTSAEIERVIYARVSDFKFLERASGAERQEQWSVKIPKTDENAGSGSIRVRKVTNLREPGAAVQYVLTSKLDVGSAGHSAETSEQSSVDQFNIFKYLANKGMLKDRYTFPIEGSDLNWEVDCFPKPGELYFEWVKIDLEKWPSGKELPQLPFAVAEMVDGDKTNQNEETQAKISRLYEDVFLLPNTKEPLSNYEQSDSGQPGVAADDEHVQGLGPGAEGGDDDQNDNAGADAGNGENDKPEGDGGEGQNDNADGDNKPAEGDDQNADNKKAEGEDDSEGKDDKGDGDKPANFADGVAEATVEAFSSAGQTLVPLIPILGPLVTVIYGQRGMDLGGIEMRQHTTKTDSHIDGNGRKTSHTSKTGSYHMSDLTDAKDYIGIIEKACSEAKSMKNKLVEIDLTLWPQKDGKFGLINIKTNRDGETKIFTENNPGKLKWFSMSLAGKRVIKLTGDDVTRFEFNNRTVRCPFNGETVEFDCSQLRHLKYTTKPNASHEFDIIEYNFDA